MIFDNRGVVIPDVSFYQDDNNTPNGIDFNRMKAAGAAGVIIRAGQNTWKDSDFQINWQAAKAAGLPRGAYWFFDSRAEPGNQASLWHGLIGNDLPELGLWADFEEAYGGTWAGEKNWKTFLEGIRIHFPKTLIGIYTANWWWHSQTVRDPDYFSMYPLWVSQYTGNPAFVDLPYPWRSQQAVLWQYTSKGDGPKYGTESLNVDLSFFNGDLDAYRDYFKLTGDILPPEPPTGEPMSTIYGTVISGTFASPLNVRSGPGTSYSDLGNLYIGDKLEASDKIGGWWKITRIIRANGTIEFPASTDTYAYENGGLYIRTDAAPIDPQPTATLKHTIKIYDNGSYQVDNGPIVA